MTEDFMARFTPKMTEAEKQIFAEKVFEARKNNPAISWIAAMYAGRAAFPGRETIPVQVMGPSSYPWLMRKLKALCKKTGHNIFPEKKEKKSVIQKSNTARIEKQNRQKQIATTIYEIRREHPELTWKAVFARVNERLPANNQFSRQLNSPAQAPWLLNLLNEMTEADRNSKPECASPEIQPLGQSVSTPAIEQLPVSEAMPLIGKEPPADLPQDNPAAGMQSLETALIQAIVSTVKPLVLNIINSPQFANTLIAAFRDVNPIPMGTSHPIIAEALKPAKADVRPKVLIVGLLGQQAQEIQNEWSKIYDLRIFDSDVTSEKIRSLIPHCDRAILMTKFVSHRAQDAMRGCSGFTYCNGGVSSLKEILNRRNGHSAN